MQPCLQTFAKMKTLHGRMRCAQSTYETLKTEVCAACCCCAPTVTPDAHAQAGKDDLEIDLSPLLRIQALRVCSGCTWHLACMRSTDACAHTDTWEHSGAPAIESSPLLRLEHLRVLSAFGWHTSIRNVAAVMQLEELQTSTWEPENCDVILHAALRGGTHSNPLFMVFLIVIWGRAPALQELHINVSY